MGKADFYAHGDYNAICYECGRKFKASTMRKHWRGYFVCQDHWEARHPQDLVGTPRPETAPPWVQAPPGIIFVEEVAELPDDPTPPPGTDVPDPPPVIPPSLPPGSPPEYVDNNTYLTDEDGNRLTDQDGNFLIL